MLNFLNDCICDDPNVQKNHKVIENVNNNNNNNTSINNNNNNNNHNVTPLPNPNELNGNANRHIKSTNDRKRFNRITSKCPEFMQNYCMCFFRKIEPIERNSKIELQNGTPIIPIKLDSDVYVPFFQLSFNLEK